MSTETITVVVAAPRQPAEVRAIPNTLEALQEIVGGYVEELPRAWEIAGCVVVANEDGHTLGLEPNRAWAGGHLVGTVVVVKRGSDADYESIPVATAEEVARLLDATSVAT